MPLDKEVNRREGVSRQQTVDLTSNDTVDHDRGPPIMGFTPLYDIEHHIQIHEDQR